MPYHTLDDLKLDISEQELVQLTDDGDLGTIDEAVHGAARADADALIDGYLVGGGYAVPLSTVPAIVKKLSREITLYNLHKRRLKLNIPESLENTFKSQIKLLEGIQAGKIRLGIESSSTSPTGGIIRSNKTKADRVFSDDELKKW